MKFIVEHLDWLGVVVGLAGAYLLAKTRFIGLIVVAFTNTIWIFWAFGTRTYSLGFLQCCFLFLNIRTLVEWMKAEKRKQEDTRDDSYKKLRRLITKIKPVK